jgi:hypothetical protein
MKILRPDHRFGFAGRVTKEGGLDFRTGYPIDLQMYFDDKIDIHYMFPQDWCKTSGIPTQRFYTELKRVSYRFNASAAIHHRID